MPVGNVCCCSRNLCRRLRRNLQAGICECLHCRARANASSIRRACGRVCSPCPALERTFAASSGAGATLNGLPVIPSGSAAIARVTGSKRLNAELDRLYLGRFTILPYIPSLAYRVALVATGEIDAAFASGGSHDWDVAAADIILSEASGAVVTAEGEPLRYNQQSTGNPALVACGPGREAELLHLAKTGRFLH